MSVWTLILRSLTHFGRVNIAVALGVAAATAVLTGALIVGDSMRRSLRDISQERLGRIDEVLLSEHMFRQELAEELAQSEGFSDRFSAAVPAITFPRVTVDRGGEGQSSEVFLLGIPDAFWELDTNDVRPQVSLGNREIVLNAQLAGDLGIDPEQVRAGEDVRVTLRIPKQQNLHSDSALGNKEDVVTNAPRLRVVDVLPNRGLARFGLSPTQNITRNAFVSLSYLQSLVDDGTARNELSENQETPERPINTLFVAGKDATRVPAEEDSIRLQELLVPRMVDYGLIMREVKLSHEPAGTTEPVVTNRYLSLSSLRLVLPSDVESIANEAFGTDRAQPVMTYLSNEIERADQVGRDDARQIPFSTVTGIELSDSFQPISAVTGEPMEPLSENGIALNTWAANDLGATVGETIRITYFEPETTHGELEVAERDFTLEDILVLTEPAELFSSPIPPLFDSPRTDITDRELTPYVPGFTDSDSVYDNTLPFPTQDKMRDEDDDYWQKFGATPKAFVSLDTARKLWSSRFGTSTSMRIADDDLSRDDAERLFLDKRLERGAALGMAFRPIKRQWLGSSAGTTPFDGLFLGLSMFIIASALMLVALLFRLGVEQRAIQIGTLLSLGYRRRSIAAMMISEASIVAGLGGILGVAVGIGYGALMIYGLSTWWVGAIVTPFLKLHLSATSIAGGFAAGFFVSLGTIAWTLFGTRRAPVRALLSGVMPSELRFAKSRKRWIEIVIALCLVAAVGLVGWATQLGGELQGGAFVGGGFLLLLGLLLAVWQRLRWRTAQAADKQLKQFSLRRLALSNVRRNSGRSTLTVGLVAVASFLIVAISAFQLQPTEQGTGGFDLIVETNRPIHPDLNNPQIRQEELLSDARVFDGAEIVAFRYKPGDNASCNNPYRSTQPRVLGVTREAARLFDDPDRTAFAWGGAAAKTEQQKKNPWHLLFVDDRDEDVIPVIIDQNTARYSLQIYTIGTEFEVTYDETNTVRFRVVGFLANTILQGSLLIGEDDFRQAFPDVGGYQYFLLDVPPPQGDEKLGSAQLAVLRDRYGDWGISSVTTEELLSQLMAVQNTYLSTFQSLGALGLLLGTFGLATVQLRNLLERQKEVALMRAEGYPQPRLGNMILWENSTLLIGGLAIGVFAALFAVLPHMIFGEAQVPWTYLAIMLLVIAIVGFGTSAVALRALNRMPLLESLRRE